MSETMGTVRKRVWLSPLRWVFLLDEGALPRWVGRGLLMACALWVQVSGLVFLFVLGAMYGTGAMLLPFPLMLLTLLVVMAKVRRYL